VHPHHASLDLGLAEAVLAQRVRPDLERFAALAFEEAAQGFVAGLARSGRLGFLPERVGGWWDRSAEIDVLAVSDTEKCALVGECKWSIHPVGINILSELKQKANRLAQEYDLQRVELALFSRVGYTPALRDQAREEGVALYTVDQLVHPS